MDFDALRNTFTRLHKLKMRGKQLDYSLSLKALDAMAAPTPEERRRLLEELPIRLEKSIVGTDAAGRQIIRTQVTVRGVETRVYDLVADSRAGDTLDDVVGLSGQLEGDDSLGGPLEGDESFGAATMPAAVTLVCPDDPEDCIPEPELEALQIQWAAFESDANNTATVVTADFDACVWVNDECREATSPIGWLAFVPMAASTVIAHDDCVNAIYEFAECRASDVATSFADAFRKQETIELGVA